MVNAENLMVNQAFHKVEDAPTAKDRPEESPCRSWRVRQPAGPKKSVAAEDGQSQYPEMKVAILTALQPGLLQGKGLAMGGHTNQVMPLENLVQDDPVKEAADP